MGYQSLSTHPRLNMAPSALLALLLLVGYGQVQLKLDTQPPTVVCKMEAQLEYVHISHTRFFCTFGTDLHALSVLIKTISASEPQSDVC